MHSAVKLIYITYKHQFSSSVFDALLHTEDPQRHGGKTKEKASVVC